MDVTTILKPSSIRCEQTVSSKKHALDLLSDLLAEAAGVGDARQILDGLANRERFGPTSLGESIAMPHTRLPGITTMVGAVLKLAEPVDFDWDSGGPVDLLFGLLVPEECSEKELQEVRELVRQLRDPALRAKLGTCRDPHLLYELFTDSLTVATPTIHA